MGLQKRIALVCAVLVCVGALAWILTEGGNPGTTLSYSQFLDRVGRGDVTNAVLSNRTSGAVEATVQLKDGQTAHAVLPADYKDAVVAMQGKLVNIEIRDFSTAPRQVLAKSTPFLMLLAVWVILMLIKFPNGLKGFVR